MLALLCVVSDMTMALIDAAHDKDAETKEVISTALFELGKKKPLLVLSACHSYLKKHSKVGLKKMGGLNLNVGEGRLFIFLCVLGREREIDV